MPTVKETCSCGATYEATHGAVVPSTDEFRAIHQPCRDRAAYGPPKDHDALRRANAWHVEHCRANLGDGEGNEWCTHGVQVAWAKPGPMPDGDDPRAGKPITGLLSNYRRTTRPGDPT